ncbi:MAG: hypothetical protein ACRDQZ_17890, partial [Mycobacteriales bacterium]
MKSNKRFLFACAVAVIAAFAAPTTAFASVWKHNGSNLNEFIEIGLTGGEIFHTSENNGMGCEVHATLTTEGESTWKITAFETKSCSISFGEFSGCELSTAEAKGLPWTVDVNTSDLTITGWHTKRTFKAGCGTSELNKTVGSVA